MQVSEILRVKGTTLFTVTPETMLSDCVVTMADNDIGSLVVMDHGRWRACSPSARWCGCWPGARSSTAPAPRRQSPRSRCAT